MTNNSKKLKLYTSLAILFVVFSLCFYLGRILIAGSFSPPTASEEEGGWVIFRVYDKEKDEYISGKIVITSHENLDAPLDINPYPNPILSDQKVYFEEPVLATLINVTYQTDDERRFKPTSIAPSYSQHRDKPKQNTINVWSYSNPENITAKFHKINDETNIDSVRDLKPNKLTEAVLNINITMRYTLSHYGASSWLPSYTLSTFNATLNEKYDINGIGLWMFFNDTEIYNYTNNKLGSIYSDFYYIEEMGGTICRLSPVLHKGHNQTFTIRLKDYAAEIWIFEGFLDDINETKVRVI